MTDGAGMLGAGPVRRRGIRAAVRAGLNAGWIELSHCFTMIEDAFEVLLIPLISVGLLLAADAKHKHLPGTHFLIGSTLLAGTLIMNITINGMAGLAMNLTAAREDGTLLRAKATPNGMLGLLIGKMVVISGIIMLTAVCLLIVGLAQFGGLALGRAATWLTLAWVLPLGLLALLSAGAVLGSLFCSLRSASVMMIANVMMIGIFGLTVISGIFYPITRCGRGCSGWGRHFRCTGSGSACVRRCCRATWPRWRSDIRGGTWPRPACSAPGRSPGWSLPRSCCAAWPAASPDRAWPPGESGP